MTNPIVPQKPNRSPTPRQRKTAKELVKNLLKDKPLPTGQVLENVGYAKGVAEQPSRILESPGFKEALAEIGLRKALELQGINPQKIAEKIDVLLEATDKLGQDDYTAIDKGLKHATAIYGITELPEKNVGGNTYNFFFNKTVQNEVKTMEDRIKSMLTKENKPE
jgi:hypothetical protein